MTKVVSCESTASRDFSVTRNNRRRFRDFVDLKKTAADPSAFVHIPQTSEINHGRKSYSGYL